MHLFIVHFTATVDGKHTIHGTLSASPTVDDRDSAIEEAEQRVIKSCERLFPEAAQIRFAVSQIREFEYARYAAEETE